MAWETRRGRQYYYRKKRIGRKVMSRYIGPGELGRLAEMHDQVIRMERQIEQENQKGSGINSARRMNDESRTEEHIVRAMLRGALLTAGYHTHHRQWRRRR